MDSSKEGFFYIIHSSVTPDTVYKIGKTIQDNPNKRLCNYPPGSSVKYTVAVANADTFEDVVIKVFNLKFIRRREYGLEYYEGDLYQMINTVHIIWKKLWNMENIQLNKDMDKCKPVGWTYFANEWLVKNLKSNLEPDMAYEHYKDIIEKQFNHEAASKQAFITYYNYITQVEILQSIEYDEIQEIDYPPIYAEVPPICKTAFDIKYYQENLED